MAEVNVPGIIAAKPVALDIKPVAPQGFGGMSLGDIVNMGATVQAFQKQKELMPYQVEAGKAQAQQAQIEAEKAGVDLNQHYANLIRGLMGGFLSDPDFINGNSEKMAKKIQEASSFAQKMGVRDTGGVTQQLVELAKTDPAAAYQYIKNGVQQAGGAAAQYQTQQQFQAPQVYQYGGAQQPGQPAPSGAPIGVTADQMGRPANQQQPQGMRLTFQPRQAGDVRPVAPGELEEAKLGQQYVAGLNEFGINSVAYKRNVDEVINEAKKLEKEATFGTTGVMGAAERKVGSFLGTEQGVRYKQLSKDLANVQIAALKAAGADLQTDAGKQLVRMANGDETFPPSVLISIAERTKADITNVELQRQAAAKFNQKYPGYANFGAFKQAWADNADSKVFQAMNIYRDESLNGDEKKAMIDKLLGDKKGEREQFYQKYQNINKLVNTGSL
jgi:hypothetical protein